MVSKLRTHNRFSFSVRMKRSATPFPSGSRTNEARRALDPEERDLLLKVVRQIVGPVVVTKTQPAGDAVADVAEAVADALADRLQGLEAVPARGRMQADALCRTVIDGRGGPRNSDSLLRWDPDQGEGVWNTTEATELSC